MHGVPFGGGLPQPGTPPPASSAGEADLVRRHLSGRARW
ncbi:Uncharacterised protein [Amycolatopsis camponoti]|uniref:Uncharacterized protein n=1 Tax=Amycolatopsis camponoti TaxID=2606593 RepID=A0A6I8LK05_9PSEU|nr:Uncharacterised protein [Amycolatopsis camponoti]